MPVGPVGGKGVVGAGCSLERSDSSPLPQLFDVEPVSGLGPVGGGGDRSRPRLSSGAPRQNQSRGSEMGSISSLAETNSTPSAQR